MKKFIILAFAAMLAAPSVTMAQKTVVQRITREKSYKTSTHDVSVWYQGDINFGFATGGKMNIIYDDGSEKIKTDFSRPFIETTHGVRITDYAFAGLGVGFQYAYGKMEPDYDDSPKWNTLLMPIFVNLKGYYPVNDSFAPYISLSLGGSASLLSDWNYDDGDESEKLGGGFYCKFGVGFNYKKLTFDLGLMHQGLKDIYEDSYYGERYSEKTKMNITSFYVNVGFKF